MRTVSILSDTTFLLVPDVFALNHGAPKFSQPVNPQDSPAVPTPDLQRELGHVLLIGVVGYSKLVREEKQP